MILIGFNAGKIAIGVMCVSLAILVLIIAYRKLLAYLGKGRLSKEKYCELHRLEKDPASGEIEFYFSCEEPKNVTLEILDVDYNVVRELVSKDYQSGAHIVYFDSTTLSNGFYHYQLRTENQKTTKRMQVENLLA